MAQRITICAGIDTGKRKLDVAIDGSSLQLQVENTAEGHKVLLEWLRRHKVKRIGIEASGGYELPVVTELRRKRFVVVVFQPAQVTRLCQVPLATGQERQDRCGADRRLHRRGQEDPRRPRSEAAAVCRTCYADRADRRGHQTVQKPDRDLPRSAHPEALEGRDFPRWPSATGPNSRPWWPQSANIATSPSGST